MKVPFISIESNRWSIGKWDEERKKERKVHLFERFVFQWNERRMSSNHSSHWWCDWISSDCVDDLSIHHGCWREDIMDIDQEEFQSNIHLFVVVSSRTFDLSIGFGFLRQTKIFSNLHRMWSKWNSGDFQQRLSIDHSTSTRSMSSIVAISRFVNHIASRSFRTVEHFLLFGKKFFSSLHSLFIVV